MAHLQNKINKLMTQKRMNAIDIEKATGLNRNTIYSVVSGTSKNPSAHTLQLIAKALDVSLESMLIYEDDETIDLLAANQMKILREVSCATINAAIEKDLKFSFENLISIIKEVYKYSLKKQSIDKIFIDWIIDRHQKF